MEQVARSLNDQQQKINELTRSIENLTNVVNKNDFNKAIPVSGVNSKDSFQGTLDPNALSIVQQNFWNNVLNSSTSYCSRCGGMYHKEKGVCPRRCRHCYGNHNSKDCKSKLKCQWCGSNIGIHTCNIEDLKSLAIRCPLCKTRGHLAKDCKPEYLVIARLTNVIKSFIKKNKRTSKIRIKRRRFRGIRPAKKK